MITRWVQWKVAAAVALPLMGLIALIGVVVVISGQQNRCGGTAGGGGPASAVGVTVPGWDTEQLTNAATIINQGTADGVSPHGGTIAVMTAIRESSLRNIPFGDLAGPDSAYLFQQRDPWAPREVRADPAQAAHLFFTGGQDVDGAGPDGVEAGLLDIAGWETLPPTIAAHRVQHNADPYHYESAWAAAQTIYAALTAAPQAPGGAQLVGQVNGHAPVTNSSGPLSAAAQAVADEVWAQNLGVVSMGGTRASAVDPAGHPSGNAVDFMTTGNPADYQAGRATGDAVTAYLEQNWDRLGVDYIIWWQQIKTDRDGPWTPMASRGSITANHYDHPHVNVLPGGGTGGAAPATPGCPAGNGATQVGSGGWTNPAPDARLTSGFGTRWGALHAGIDLAAPIGTPIYAAAGGLDADGNPTGGPATVISSGPASGFGWWIRLDHGNGYITVYGHMGPDDLLVGVGDQVTAGQQIARINNKGQSTGPHLHFEVHINGQKVDPAPFLAQHGVPLTALFLLVPFTAPSTRRSSHAHN